MQTGLVFVVLTLLIHMSCVIRSHENPEPGNPDIYSAAWRESKLAEAAIQAKAILQTADQVLCERLDAGDYSENTRRLIEEISSGDIKRTVDAISVHRFRGYGEGTAVPLEVQVALVSPFLSDRRGYTRIIYDPPPCPMRREIGGSISSMSAELLRENSRTNRALLPTLADYLAHEEAVPCPTAIALIPAVKYCVVEPQDIELAAAVLFEVSIRGRWTWLARPWESGGLEKQCSAYEDALRYLTALREDHPNLEWLQGIESEGSCRRLRRQVTSEGR